MKKRILSVLSVFMLGITLTACGSSEPVEAPSVAEGDKSIVQEKLNKQDNKTEDTKHSDNEKQTETAEEAAQKTDTDGTNILVAYFSRADENYNVGTVEVGNTQILAEYIADEVGADSFHIETVTPYPAGYDDCCDVAKQELSDDTKQTVHSWFDDLGF